MDKTALLFGPYTAPALKVGDETVCLFRDADVVICDWSLAPIPWPICRYVGRACGRGLLVEDELARAIRNETAAALMHWWGVSGVTVSHWRAACGIGRNDTEGSRRLRREVALGGLNARTKRAWGEVRLWGPEELALLARHTDAEVARLTGRSEHAVAHMRRQVEERT